MYIGEKSKSKCHLIVAVAYVCIGGVILVEYSGRLILYSGLGTVTGHFYSEMAVLLLLTIIRNPMD